MKHINVLYTVDKNYFYIMLVSIFSLLEHNPNILFDIHLIADGLNDEDLELLDEVVSRFDNAKYRIYEFGPVRERIEEYNMPKWNNSAMANARLFFDDYIDAKDNLLYLDSDTIIEDSLEGLFDYTGTINMVKDSMVPSTHWKSIDPNLKAYHNSGMMWINKNKWDENKCQEKIIEELKKKSDYPFPDQDIINKALKDFINTLPLNYDVFSLIKFLPLPLLLKFFGDKEINRYSSKEIRDAKRNPIISHCTPVYEWKGWTENTLNPNGNLYANYFAKIGIPLIKGDEEKIPNELLYKLLLYIKLSCPKKIKTPVKKLLIAGEDYLRSLKRTT